MMEKLFDDKHIAKKILIEDFNLQLIEEKLKLKKLQSVIKQYSNIKNKIELSGKHVDGMFYHLLVEKESRMKKNEAIVSEEISILNYNINILKK